ncbi:MAG: 16S rRNA (cytidine(1402)-2'-O)-methyltransferase [Alphaproteobacteria bacterium]|nr:16S rRNA (cytidine(1402)-2'-O)-methyltransferase [Alphaproteobacteria bacterium]
MPPGLYVVATPIGNLRDITLRALDVLRSADRIACEDTRVTAKLLQRYAIQARTISYNDHNAKKVLPDLIRRLKDGESLALVSDAGTPLISDPGYRIVAQARAEGIPVHVIPGANAAISGLVGSGLPTDAFFFAGFLPNRSGARRTRLQALAAVPGTLVFYETGPRLADSLADMAGELGDRPAAIAREITKLHEEVLRGSLVHLATETAEGPAPRGEIVVVVGPPEDAAADDDTVREAAREALKTMSVRDAASHVARQTGRARRDVYRIAQELADGGAT